MSVIVNTTGGTVVTTETEAGHQVAVSSAAPEGVTVQVNDAVPVPFPNPGPEGPAGPPGESGGSYTHNQAVPSNIWNVAHSLGYKPGGIMVEDSGGSDWVGEVEHIDDNNLTISFGTASFSGKAYIS